MDNTSNVVEASVEAKLVKNALSYATYGTQGIVAMQIATNGVREGLKHNRDSIERLRALLNRTYQFLSRDNLGIEEMLALQEAIDGEPAMK